MHGHVQVRHRKCKCQKEALPGAGTSYNILARYRTAIVALLAVETALHMWAANVALNLTGTLPAWHIPLYFHVRSQYT